MSQAIDLDQLQSARLPHLGVLLVAGADAHAFLQGQLSANLEELTTHHVLLASCNSAQGRVQAVMWLVAREDGVALVLPASLIERTTARLRKYVLRSKASIESGRLAAASARIPPEVVEGLSAERSHALVGDVSLVRLPGHADLLVLAPASNLQAADDHAALRWRRDEVAAGLPNVYPQTYETFVAQMLNLDALGGVSFAKGCYTGQEIIARAHYRGAVKRRMFRYRAESAAPQPGTRVLAGDQHAGDVVDAVAVDGGCELLAVVSLSMRAQSLTLSEPATRLEQLPLPYESALQMS